MGMEEQSLCKTFKYKLIPTPEQQGTLETVVWRCRELYNAGLQEREVPGRSATRPSPLPARALRYQTRAGCSGAMLTPAGVVPGQRGPLGRALPEQPPASAVGNMSPTRRV
jgi:hypothetical protein